MDTIWVQHMRPPSELNVEELASIRENHMEGVGAPEWRRCCALGRRSLGAAVAVGKSCKLELT